MAVRNKSSVRAATVQDQRWVSLRSTHLRQLRQRRRSLV